MKLSTDMLKVLIYSKQLWPEVIHPSDEADSKIILPEEVQKQIASIKENYSSQSAYRRLDFQNQIGSVQLEIEIGSKVETVQCSPVQASIISYCQDKEQIPLREIAEAIGLEMVQVQKRISFWISRGILKESKGIYKLYKL